MSTGFLKFFCSFFLMNYDIISIMPSSIKDLSVFAPAKVNLHLAVKEKRADGFHNIESVFLAVDFGDFLHLRFDSAGNFAGSTGNCNGECYIETVNLAADTGLNSCIPVEDNIIYKAVSIFRRKTGFSRNIRIKLEKNIPVGGGLGGGSSNAAVTLLTLNKIAGFPFNREELLEMGAALGSDVPFFILQTPAAHVTGRGEKIEPIEASDMFLVLVNPGFPSNTKAAFKLLDEYRERTIKNEKSMFTNDFLEVFNEPEKSVYFEIISQLKENGAYYANLSGSGSTCFGLFSDFEQAQNISNFLYKKWRFIRTAKIYYY